MALVDLLGKAAAPGRIRGIALDAWTRAKADPARARAVFSTTLREARALHSAERRLVQDALYGLVREEHGLARLLGTDEPLALWLGWLVRRGLSPDRAAEQHGAPFAALARWDELPPELRHSIPDPLHRRLADPLGPALGSFLAACDERAPIVLRANRLRCDRVRLAERLRGEGITTVPCGSAPDGLLVEGRANVEDTAAFRDGWFELQDEGSQRVAALVEPDGPVIDFCAGAGGKALALAAEGVPVLALDVRERPLDELRKRARRAGADVRTRRIPDDGPVEAEAASRVLADVPCTGTGVLRRHPELRWRWTEPRLAELLALQARILDRASALVRPGGRLVYATCSVLRAEDEDQVAAFLARRPGFALVRELRTWPHVDRCDGFYAAVLTRT